MKLSLFSIFLALVFSATATLAHADTVNYLGLLNRTPVTLSFNVPTPNLLVEEPETTFSELTNQNETRINLVTHSGSVTLSYGKLTETAPIYLMESEEDPAIPNDPTHSHFIFISLTALPQLAMNFTNAETHFFPVKLDQNKIVSITFPETYTLDYGDLSSDDPSAQTLGKVTLIRQK